MAAGGGFAAASRCERERVIRISFPSTTMADLSDFDTLSGSEEPQQVQPAEQSDMVGFAGPALAEEESREGGRRDKKTQQACGNNWLRCGASAPAPARAGGRARNLLLRPRGKGGMLQSKNRSPACACCGRLRRANLHAHTLPHKHTPINHAWRAHSRGAGCGRLGYHSRCALHHSERLVSAPCGLESSAPEKQRARMFRRQASPSSPPPLLLLSRTTS